MTKAVAANEIMKLSYMYQITHEEANIQHAIYDLWYKYYSDTTLTIDERILMTEQFATEYAKSSDVKVDKPFLRHPATRLKDFSRSYTIAEILADFILQINQVAERDEEYPVHGVEKVFRDTVKDRSRFIGIYSQDEEDQDILADGEYIRKKGIPRRLDTVMSKYDMAEYSIIEKQTKVGEPLYEVESEKKAINKFKRILMNEKKHAIGYARLYANDGYDFKEALRRISKLDITRVRTCIECGNVFYAHDRRRYICDLQHGIVKDRHNGKWQRSDHSHCEVENAKKRSEKQRESA